jgi:hypothetical protein
MKVIVGLFTLLAIPLTLLNMFGGIISGVWLAVLGDWGSIGYGLFAIISSSFLLAIAMMPSLIFAGPAVYFAGKGVTILFYFFSFLSTLYIVGLITAWSGSVLWFFAERATAESFIPILVWSFGVALAPWQWMAQKEAQAGDGPGSAITVFFAQIAYVLAILMAIFGTFTLFEIMLMFGIIMLIGVFFQFGAAVQAMRSDPQLDY